MNVAEEEKVSSGIETPVRSSNNAMDISSPGNLSAEEKSRKRKTWLKNLSVLSSEEDDLDGESSSVKRSLPTNEIWELRFPYPMVSDDSEDDKEDAEVFQLKSTKKKGLKRRLHFSDEELEVKNENESFKDKKRKLESSQTQNAPISNNGKLQQKLKKKNNKIHPSKIVEPNIENKQKENQTDNLTKKTPKVSLESLKSECIEMQYADPTSFLFGCSLKKPAKAKGKPGKKKKVAAVLFKVLPPLEPVQQIRHTAVTIPVQMVEGSEEIIVDPKRFLESSDEENETNTAVSNSGRRLHQLSTSSSDSDVKKNTSKPKQARAKQKVRKQKPKSVHCLSSSSEDENSSHKVTNDKTEGNECYLDQRKADLGTFQAKQTNDKKDSTFKSKPIDRKDSTFKSKPISSGKKRDRPSFKDKKEPVKVNISAWKNIANVKLKRKQSKPSSTYHLSIVNNLKKQLATSNQAEVEIRKKINDISNRTDKENQNSCPKKTLSTSKDTPKHDATTKENIFSSKENVHNNQHREEEGVGIIADNRNPIENNYTVNLNVYCSPSHDSRNDDDFESGTNQSNELKTSLDINLSLTHNKEGESSSASKKVRMAHNRRPSVQLNVQGADHKELLENDRKVGGSLGKDEAAGNITESSPVNDILGNILSEMEKNPYKIAKPIKNTVESPNSKPFMPFPPFHLNPVNNFNPFTLPTNQCFASGSVIANPNVSSLPNVAKEGLKSYSPSINPLKEGLFTNVMSSNESLESELLKFVGSSNSVKSQIHSGNIPESLKTVVSKSLHVSHSNKNVTAQVTSKESPVNVLSTSEPGSHVIAVDPANESSKLVIPFYSVRNEEYSAVDVNKETKLPQKTNNDQVASSRINVDDSRANNSRSSTYRKTVKAKEKDNALQRCSVIFRGENKPDLLVNKDKLNLISKEPCVVTNICKPYFSGKHLNLNKSKKNEDPSSNKPSNSEEIVKDSSVISKPRIIKRNRQAHTLSSSEDDSEEQQSSEPPQNKNNPGSPKGIRVRFGGSEYRFKGSNQIVKDKKHKDTEAKASKEVRKDLSKAGDDDPKLFSNEESSSSSSSSSSKCSSKSSESESSDEEYEPIVTDVSLEGINTTEVTDGKCDITDTPCLNLPSTEISLDPTLDKDLKANPKSVCTEVITLSSDSEPESADHIAENCLGNSTQVVQSLNPVKETSNENKEMPENSLTCSAVKETPGQSSSTCEGNQPRAKAIKEMSEQNVTDYAAKETPGQSNSTCEENQARADKSNKMKEIPEHNVIFSAPEKNNVGKIRIKSLFELGVVNEGSIPENALKPSGSIPENALNPPGSTSENTLETPTDMVCEQDEGPLDQEQNKSIKPPKFITKPSNNSPHSVNKRKLEKIVIRRNNEAYAVAKGTKQTEVSQGTSDSQYNVFKRGTIIGVARPMDFTGQHGRHKPNIIRLRKVQTETAKENPPQAPSSTEKDPNSLSSQTTTSINTISSSSIQPSNTTMIIKPNVSVVNNWHSSNNLPPFNNPRTILVTSNNSANTANYLPSNTSANSNPPNSEKDPNSLSSQTTTSTNTISSSSIQPSNTTMILESNVSVVNNLLSSNNPPTILVTSNNSVNTADYLPSNTSANTNLPKSVCSTQQSSTKQSFVPIFTISFPSLSAATDEVIPQSGHQTTNPQIPITADPLQVQTSEITEQLLDSQAAKCFDEFFSELTCMKIPKLVDELHLLITYDTIRDEQLQKVGQLLHPEMAASESRRAEKDFGDKLRTRAQEFVPLLMTILKRVDANNLQFSTLALYCRIVQLLERINPVNIRYRFRLRTLIRCMLDKQPSAVTVDIDFFFSEGEQTFIASFNDMYGKLMKYEAYLDDLRKKEAEETVRKEAASEANATTTEKPQDPSDDAVKKPHVEATKRTSESQKTINSISVTEKSAPMKISTQSDNVVEPGKVSKSTSLDDRAVQMNHLIDELVSLNQLWSRVRVLPRSKSLIDHTQLSASTSQIRELTTSRPDSLTDHNYQIPSTSQSRESTTPATTTPGSAMNTSSATIDTGASLNDLNSTDINSWSAETFSITAPSSSTIPMDNYTSTDNSSMIDANPSVQNPPPFPNQEISATTTPAPKPKGLDQLFLGKFLKSINKK